LERADVGAALEEVRREGVAQRAARRSLWDARGSHGCSHGLLDDGLVDVVPAALPGLEMVVGARGGENPLPRPLLACGGQLAGECVRELDEPLACCQVACVLKVRVREPRSELGFQEW
jgi:hypothetical protein